MKITIDTREQTPWHFDRSVAEATVGTLRTGDYAITGDTGFAVERKSMDDFLSTISKGWSRFQREIYRAKERGFGLPIVVEGMFSDVLFHMEKYNSAVARYLRSGNRDPELDQIIKSIKDLEEKLVELGKAFELRYHCVVPPQHDHDKLTPAFVLKRIGELYAMGASVFFAERAEYAVAAGYAMLHGRNELLKDDDDDVRRKEDKRQD